ncbi:glycosyltransferase family 61 protein [Kordiimonas pumila]|uniref:Glycosyltransferase family 61 protein n=1 Tax=Kordiimonas pumila TaxID=2161677 RepID=A0ABV7D299_9PROT|nr:glycosyltransferase family 61 protein [Kordiimonas pumila]
MELFQIKHWLILDNPTCVEELTIGEQGKHLGGETQHWYSTFLSKLITQKAFHSENTPKKICILRGHLSSGRLTLEKELEFFLEKEGYTPFYPENHCIKEQLSTLYNAEKVIMSEGSAVHLFDILPPIKAEVAYLSRRPNQVHTFLEPKISKLSIFSGQLAFLPKSPQGRNRNKALSYLCGDSVLEFLRSEAFLEKSNSKLSKDYYNDLKDFLDKSSEPFLKDAEDMESYLVQLLISELARKQKKIRTLNAENTYLQAHLALHDKKYDTAKEYADHFHIMEPSDERNQILSEAMNATYNELKK